MSAIKANARHPCFAKSAPDSVSRNPEKPPMMNDSEPSLCQTLGLQTSPQFRPARSR